MRTSHDRIGSCATCGRQARLTFHPLIPRMQHRKQRCYDRAAPRRAR